MRVFGCCGVHATAAVWGCPAERDVGDEEAAAGDDETATASWARAVSGVPAARRRYDALPRESPAALTFFRRATPFAELATVRLASHLVSRAGDAERLALEDLRSARHPPWLVFSWTQIRANLAGWYGLGSAQEAEIAAGGLPLLREIYVGCASSPSALDSAQISLGTADMATARRYATLAPATERTGRRCCARSRRSTHAACPRCSGSRDSVSSCWRTCRHCCARSGCAIPTWTRRTSSRAPAAPASCARRRRAEGAARLPARGHPPQHQRHRRRSPVQRMSGLAHK